MTRGRSAGGTWVSTLGSRFDLRDLELFVAVADAGSIARAAERSHTVASAVSKRISDLEDGLGCALLLRGAKGVELTAAGNALLARARVLLHQAAQLDDEMRRHASGSRGYVRMFANISAIVEFLPDALASFAQQHPDIHVHLEEHISSDVATAVADNSADLGIVSELPAIDGLTTVPFRKDDLVVVLKPDHPLASRQSVAFADLVDEPFVGLHAGSSLNRLLARAAMEINHTVNWRVHVTSFDAACAMVAAGLGVGVVPKAATTAYIRSLSLASLTLTDDWAHRQLFLCVRSGAPLHSAAKLLFDHLQNVASKGPRPLSARPEVSKK
ncbi:MAG: LysR substrate-binding domain-containing protein [Steroidobacter sp.]